MPQYRFLTDQPTPADVEALFAESEVWLTRRDVAEMLGVSRSQRLINILEQLVADGVLERRTTALANRANVFVYGKPHNA
jgi:predicted transcriptional regulator